MVSKGFDPKDLEDICSRKRNKFTMKKADYKELGRNLLLGSVDVVIGSIQATALTAKIINSPNNLKKTDYLKIEQNDRDDRAWKRGDYIEVNNSDD